MSFHLHMQEHRHLAPKQRSPVVNALLFALIFTFASIILDRAVTEGRVLRVVLGEASKATSVIIEKGRRLVHRGASGQG